MFYHAAPPRRAHRRPQVRHINAHSPIAAVPELRLTVEECVVVQRSVRQDCVSLCQLDCNEYRTPAPCSWIHVAVVMLPHQCMRPRHCSTVQTHPPSYPPIFPVSIRAIYVAFQASCSQEAIALKRSSPSHRSRSPPDRRLAARMVLVASRRAWW